MLIGHKRQWEFLKRSFEQKTFSHGYLFSGPEDIGKKTLAIEFVKFCHCQEKNPELKPCNKCSSCTSFLKGLHPDNFLLEPQEEKKEIHISEIRDLIYKLSLKPFLSSLKTAVIDEAHLMNIQAQNCFLKTLEEPKGDTLLILVTSRPDLLTETVRSRLQEIKFFSFSKPEILKFLKEKKIETKRAEEIAEISLGRIGRAIKFAKMPASLEKEKERVLLFTKILKADIVERFQYAKKLSQGRLENIFEAWLRYLRKVLLQKINDLKKEKTSEMKKYSFIEIKKMIRELEKINFLVSNKSVNKKLALEILMINLEN